jgi:hypothetical protein
MTTPSGPVVSHRFRVGLLAGAFSCLILSGAQAGHPRVEDWQGQYTCGQGLTGLTLAMTTDLSGQVQALFHFYGIPQNPTVPDGCFMMSGSVQARHLVLLPGEWRKHPANYVSVGLTGDFGADERLAGTITGPGCTVFMLSRVAQAPVLDDCGSAIS